MSRRRILVRRHTRTLTDDVMLPLAYTRTFRRPPRVMWGLHQTIEQARVWAGCSTLSNRRAFRSGPDSSGIESLVPIVRVLRS